MTDKPIIIPAMRIPAFREGRMTQMRVPLDPQPTCRLPSGAVLAHEKDLLYSIGDRLWVRETYYRDEHGLRFKASNHISPFGWRSPVTMPRWASRTTLVVNDVRVQRVQEISAEDCEREGIKISDGALFRDGYMVANRKDFRWLWNTLHGPDAWDRNDWVCAISFDVHLCNIDQMPGDV